MKFDVPATLTQRDWSLQRKGQDDQARHKERVDEAIRENLTNIIADEAIITSDGKAIVRVPVRSLDEYYFRNQRDKQKMIGQGDGDTQIGDLIARDQSEGGPGDQAGDQPGHDVYEAYVDIDDLAALVFEDLGLPHLVEKRTQAIESESIIFSDVRKTGPMSNLDKRRTMRENIKRNARLGHPRFADVNQDDLRFKTWETEVRYQTNAVVFALMDVSGSMDTFKKYLCRAFYFWMVRFLRTQYSNVEIIFISHHTEAKQVTENQFFHRGESGGTLASSAFDLTLQMIHDQFPASDWNIYCQYMGDGDNWGQDNIRCRELVSQLFSHVNQLGYAEVRYSGLSMSPLNAELFKLKDPRLVRLTLDSKNDVWKALQHFFHKDLSKEA